MTDSPLSDPVVVRAEQLAHGHDTEVHPDALRAARATRALTSWIVTSDPGHPHLAEVADALEAALALAGEPARSRYRSGPPARPADLQPNIRSTHPMVGEANPSAPPIRIHGDAGRAIGEVTFTPAQEGYPGCAHGGWIAAGFDIVLGVASAAARDGGGLTGSLRIRYTDLTPVGVPVRYEAWVDRVDGRKTTVLGTLSRLDREGGPHRCAEAEAVFVTPASSPGA